MTPLESMRQQLLKQHLPGGKSGYLAIATALILSVIIVIVGTVAAAMVFFGRMDTLVLSDKERVYFLAESCYEFALLQLAKDSGYSGTSKVSVGSSTCDVVSVTEEGNNRIIKTRASTTYSHTNLKFVVASSTFEIVSREEIL